MVQHLIYICNLFNLHVNAVRGGWDDCPITNKYSSDAGSGADLIIHLAQAWNGLDLAIYTDFTHKSKVSLWFYPHGQAYDS